MTQITIGQRFGRAALVALSGGIVALAIMMSDRMFRFDYGFLRAATMGAFLAGLLVARGFGGQGGWGWFRFGLTFGIATILGALFAVPLLGFDAWLMRTDVMRTLGDLIGSALLGPVYVLSLIGGKLLVLKVWLAIGVLIHLFVMGGSARRAPQVPWPHAPRATSPASANHDAT